MSGNVMSIFQEGEPQSGEMFDKEVSKLPFPEGVPYTLDHTNEGLAPIFLGSGEQIKELNTLAKLGSFALPSTRTIS